MKIQPHLLGDLQPSPTQKQVPGTQDLFRQALKDVQNFKSDSAAPLGGQPLTFSQHAVDRMQSRGIHFDKSSLARLQKGVEQAAAKGAKESLFIVDDKAMIVSVKNRKVITVMDQQQLKENVFTNIDSALIL